MNLPTASPGLPNCNSLILLSFSKTLRRLSEGSEEKLRPARSFNPKVSIRPSSPVFSKNVELGRTPASGLTYSTFPYRGDSPGVKLLAVIDLNSGSLRTSRLKEKYFVLLVVSEFNDAGAFIVTTLLKSIPV